MLGKLYRLCINENYFTAGSTDQYEKMFHLAENGASAHDISLVIWLCSVDVSLKDIEEAVRKIFESED